MGSNNAKPSGATLTESGELILPGVDIAGSPEFAWDEIRKHNSLEDCWVVIHGLVFDVTPFLFEHPGGAHLITAYAGRDATEEFEGNNHSQRARTLLIDYFKGRLVKGGAASSTSVPSSTVSASGASTADSTSTTSSPASDSPTASTSTTTSSTQSASSPSFSSLSSSSASSLPALKVFYATQKGTARRYAQTLASEAITRKLVSSSVAVDLKSYEPEDLPGENAVVIFVMSTYTDGQPTDSGKFFCSWLEDACTDFRVHKGFLSRLRYSVFGLGNSLYDENFNKVAYTVDKWMQVGGATRFVSCGVGDDNVARNDAEGTQETDFQAWLARCMTALGALAAKTQAEAAAASSSSSSGCCTNCNCQSSSSSSSSTPLSAEQEAEIMEDLAAEDDDEEEAPSGPLAKGAGEPLVDVEDMGNMMKGASGAAAGRKTRRPPRTKAQRKAAQAAAAAAAADGNVADDAADAADAAEVIDDENEDEEALVAAIASGAVTAREMVTPEIRKSLSKQGYRVIGSHSGVKLCRWTKAMLRGRGGCYKHTCYGIKSYSCMEMTPSLACANKCVFCWRHHTNPVGKEWKWQLDEPEFIVEQGVTNHLAMIRQMKGVPGVKKERLDDALTIRHCALSLVGEPIMYPHINRFVDLLHQRRISTFLVTNAQFPDRIRELKPVTQLYVSVDASTPEALKAVDRPLFKDYWERFLDSLSEIGKKQTRTVYRLTLIKAWNMDEIANYASLISRGNPEFIEIKGVTFCGSNDASNLTMKNVPFHEEVVYFSKELLKYISDDYDLACEHAHSCTLLIAHKKFRVDGRWHTWIDYDKFHELAATGQPFTSLDYAAPTPEWAVFGNAAAGFDPEEERVFVKGVKKRELSQLGDGASIAGDSVAGDLNEDDYKNELDIAAVNSGC